MAKVKTLKQAKAFVKKSRLCTIFSGTVDGITSLWDAVDLPEAGGGNTNWGARMEAVWAWKNELPAEFPDEIFYGKLKGGQAVLMTLDYLRENHYPAASKPLEECSELAQEIFELIRNEGGTTGELRKLAIAKFGCTKSRFDTALKQLQTTLNIARVNEKTNVNDRWVPFVEVYADIALA